LINISKVWLVVNWKNNIRNTFFYLYNWLKISAGGRDMKGDFLIKKYKFGIAKNKRHGTIELRTR